MKPVLRGPPSRLGSPPHWSRGLWVVYTGPVRCDQRELRKKLKFFKFKIQMMWAQQSNLYNKVIMSMCLDYCRDA